MEYSKWTISSMIGVLLFLGLSGCEGPGPEYQTPMVAYPEHQAAPLFIPLS